MRDILVIAQYCGQFDGSVNNRSNYIADLIYRSGFNVELVTTDFFHGKKEKRPDVEDGKYNYKITFIAEPEYTKNVSFKRIYSNIVVGNNLEKYLSTRIPPDVIYCTVPSLDIAASAAKYAKKNNVKFIIDVIDIWPEAFKLVFNVPIISKLVYYPLKKKADYIYNVADEIIAVSQTYADRALKSSNKCKNGYAVFLGTDLSIFDTYARENKFNNKPANEFWLVYLGTLGHSYDLTCVIDALSIIKKEGISNIKFIVMGDGPLRQRFENCAKEKGVYCEFTGNLQYQEMVGRLVSCDIAVNPISCGAAQSIIYKHADYAAAGLPVLNTQECAEYRELVEKYETGLNCENNNPNDLAEKLLFLYNDSQMRKCMGENHRRLAEEKFDRAKTYKKIIELLQG